MYSFEYRETMVQKILSTDGPSIDVVAKRNGVPVRTLYRWKTQYLNGSEVNMCKKSRKPQDWRVEEKFQAVVEAENLSEEVLGGWCRGKGIHSSQLQQWREQFLSGVRKGPKVDPEKQKMKAEIKGLKKELRRKDKVLAETAALLVLKKKMSEIWGEDEDD